MDANWDEMFTELPDKVVKGKKGKAVFWYESDNALTSFEKYRIKQQRLRDMEARRIEKIHARDQQRWVDGQKFANARKRLRAKQEYERLLKKDFKDWSPALRAEYERKRAAAARDEGQQLNAHISNAHSAIRTIEHQIEMNSFRVEFRTQLTRQIEAGCVKDRARGGVARGARGSDARAFSPPPSRARRVTRAIVCSSRSQVPSRRVEARGVRAGQRREARRL